MRCSENAGVHEERWSFCCSRWRLGYRGGRVRIGHCQNEVLAQELCSELLHRFPQADIKSYPLRGLCSYYAERGGIMLGFEA